MFTAWYKKNSLGFYSLSKEKKRYMAVFVSSYSIANVYLHGSCTGGEF